MSNEMNEKPANQSDLMSETSSHLWEDEESQEEDPVWQACLKEIDSWIPVVETPDDPFDFEIPKEFKCNAGEDLVAIIEAAKAYEKWLKLCNPNYDAEPEKLDGRTYGKPWRKDWHLVCSGCWVSRNREWIIERQTFPTLEPPGYGPMVEDLWVIYAGEGDTRMSIAESFEARASTWVDRASTLEGAVELTMSGLDPERFMLR